MNEEARRALTRLCEKVRAMLGRADMLAEPARDSLLFDLSVIDRVFAQPETEGGFHGPGFSEVMQNDMRHLMEVLGISTHARPESPHEVFVSEIIPRCVELMEVKEVKAELEKSRQESNRLYGIGQEYDADTKEMRAFLWDAHRDIMEWVRTATRIRREIEDPDHTPWCPHERGIQESIELASRICAKAGEGQGDAKN